MIDGTSSGLRQRRKPVSLKSVKELDAFPKVSTSYQESTATGGGVTILVFAVIVILVYSEIQYYTSSELLFEYDIDPNHSQKLKVNIDITVAMKCNQIGADILDLTNQNARLFGNLDEHPVHFELSPDQKRFADMNRNLNNYVKNAYHSIHEFLWKTGFTGQYSEMPPREDNISTPPDACRFNGTLEVNKVAGNFHVTVGKHVPFMGGQHAHLTMGIDMSSYNFSHRIDHLSFGDLAYGRVNPLDGDLHVTNTPLHLFNYFVQVVPTNVNTRQAKVDTFQYAVTERNRTIDHSAGSHGVPGIYIKYDLFPLRVNVKEEYKPYWQFLIRLCGIVGGIFATSGMLHNLASFMMDLVCCRLNVGKYRPSHHDMSPAPAPFPSSPSTAPSSSLLTSINSAENNSTNKPIVLPQSSELQSQPLFSASDVNNIVDSSKEGHS